MYDPEGPSWKELMRADLTVPGGDLDKCSAFILHRGGDRCSRPSTTVYARHGQGVVQLISVCDRCDMRLGDGMTTGEAHVLLVMRS